MQLPYLSYITHFRTVLIWLLCMIAGFISSYCVLVYFLFILNICVFKVEPSQRRISVTFGKNLFIPIAQFCTAHIKSKENLLNFVDATS